jgi:hypothetical protein
MNWFLALPFSSDQAFFWPISILFRALFEVGNQALCLTF